jgi:hypothetical protein
VISKKNGNTVNKKLLKSNEKYSRKPLQQTGKRGRWDSVLKTK